MSAVAVQLCILSLGCLGVHALRDHARLVTPVLASVALVLALLVLGVLSARYSMPADPDMLMGRWTGD